MQFSIRIGDLFSGLDIVNATIDRKGKDSPIFFHAVKNDASDVIRIYSTSWYAETITQIPAKVTEEGTCIVHADQLYIGLQGKDKEETITFSAKGENQFSIKSKRSKFVISKLASTSNPADTIMKAILSDPIVTVEGNDLLDILKSVAPATALESDSVQTFIFQSVRLTFGKNMMAEATDGKCAAVARKPIDHPIEKIYLLDSKAIKVINTNIKKSKESNPIEIREANNKLYVKTKVCSFSTGTLVRSFPTVVAVTDTIKFDKAFNVIADDLKGIVNRAVAFTSNPQIIIETKDKQIFVRNVGMLATFEESLDIDTEATFKAKFVGPALVKLLNGHIESQIKISNPEKDRPMGLYSKTKSGLEVKQVILPIN